jgi:hypothetical protein
VSLEAGEVVDATSATEPTVRLDGDTEAWATLNHAAGYTPVNGDRVLVLVENFKRRYIEREVP